MSMSILIIVLFFEGYGFVGIFMGGGFFANNLKDLSIGLVEVSEMKTGL